MVPGKIKPFKKTKKLYNIFVNTNPSMKISVQKISKKTDMCPVCVKGEKAQNMEIYLHLKMGVNMGEKECNIINLYSLQHQFLDTF